LKRQAERERPSAQGVEKRRCRSIIARRKLEWR
jgi:hypothetical protein